jgi:DNA sulfur modification protein DndB
MVNSFEYIFPAIRGVQGGREYYAAMCPLRLLPRLFVFDDDELLPELRAQRLLNKARVPEIARYVLSNRNDYVFSAITASVDGNVRFDPVGEKAEESQIGTFRVDMRAKFIINDGQHRRAAIEQALREDPSLSDETIAVVFFVDRGLERSQQMFADLNRHAIRPSRSLGLLYDHRSDLSRLARLVATNSEAFRGVVEMERSTLAERSRKLFTLSAIYSATSAYLGERKFDNLEQAANISVEYWDEVGKHLREWSLVRASKMTAGEVRRDFIHSHAVVLQALGCVGYDLAMRDKQWRNRLSLLASIDWSRSNAKLWEGRALIGGRVSKTSNSVLLTTAAIKTKLAIPLSAEEQRVEAAVRRSSKSASASSTQV